MRQRAVEVALHRSGPPKTTRVSEAPARCIQRRAASLRSLTPLETYCPGQVSPAQVSIRDVGLAQVGLKKAGVGQVSIGQVGSTEHSTVQRGAIRLQTGPAHYSDEGNASPCAPPAAVPSQSADVAQTLPVNAR